MAVEASIINLDNYTKAKLETRRKACRINRSSAVLPKSTGVSKLPGFPRLHVARVLVVPATASRPKLFEVENGDSRVRTVRRMKKDAD